MFNDIGREFRACPPEDTVRRVITILDESEIQTRVVFQANPYPGIHSTRVETAAEHGGFGTNGKGRTEAWSLASAYAELMERIQNGLMFRALSRANTEALKRRSGFSYAPDEILLDRRLCLSLPAEIRADLAGVQGRPQEEFFTEYYDRIESRSEGCLALPLRSAVTGEVTAIPANLLLLAVGSNGMAAGNTLIEAVYQALMEVVERYASSLVHFGRLAPPTIPHDSLRRFPAELAVIRQIEAGGKFRVVVKDFSASRGLPALGILVINRHTGRYRLNVGADSAMRVALSRCLTEVFQGVMDEEGMEAVQQPVPDRELEHFLDDSPENLRKRELEFQMFTKDGSGAFPASLFGTEESYNHDPRTFEVAGSYLAEIRRMVELFRSMGRDVLVRNCSFLGFPSCLVYIPGISPVGRKSGSLPGTKPGALAFAWDDIEPLILSGNGAEPDRWSRIAEVLDQLQPECPAAELLGLDFDPECSWARVPVCFLAALCHHRADQPEGAGRALEQFHRLGSANSVYYDCARHYLQERAARAEGLELRERLVSKGYPGALIEEVCADLDSPDNAFRYLPLPRCPECADCPLAAQCQTRRRLDAAACMHQRMRIPFPESLTDINPGPVGP